MTRIPGEWRYFDEALGIPYPWYTSTALKIIETWDLSGKRIFEYGAGDSTKWFIARGATVFGVDNEIQYTGCGVQFKPYFPEYCSAILEYHEPFDIVIIDGEWRDECTEYALNALKPGGFLIIDNFHQKSVPFLWTKTDKLIEGMTHGLHKEPDHEDWITAIIYKPNNTRLI